MAKRRKSSKRERTPVIDTLLDLAAAATLDYIAYKRREKRKGKRGNRIDPYAATGMAMGLGLIDDTEDLIRFGGMLGAMGAFDPDEPDEVYQSSYVGRYEENPFYAPKNNKYAWRLNCEDGSDYGISPEDYETRDKYHDALRHEKYQWRDCCAVDVDLGVNPEDYETEEEYQNALEMAKDNLSEDDDGLTGDAEVAVQDEDAKKRNAEGNSYAEDDSPLPSNEQTEPLDIYENDDFHVFIYCKVEINGTADYYRTEDRSIKKGDTVIVQADGKLVAGTILSIEHHMRFSVPKDVCQTPPILSKQLGLGDSP